MKADVDEGQAFDARMRAAMDRTMMHSARLGFVESAASRQSHTLVDCRGHLAAGGDRRPEVNPEAVVTRALGFRSWNEADDDPEAPGHRRRRFRGGRRP